MRSSLYIPTLLDTKTSADLGSGIDSQVVKIPREYGGERRAYGLVGDNAEQSEQPCQRHTGALNYYAVGTRPDITYTVSRLSEANSGLSKEHLGLLKHLFRYVIGTVDLCLVYGSNLSIG